MMRRHRALYSHAERTAMVEACASERVRSGVPRDHALRDCVAEMRRRTRSSSVSWRAKAPKRWIQHAVRHPGALRNAVLRIYGRKAGFDGQGRIRCSVLRELAAHPVHGARARLALRLRGFVGVVCPVGGR